MFLFDKYHSGKQSYATGIDCNLRWKTMLPSMPIYAAESMAAVDDDCNLYFGCHSGIFYSLNKDGHIRWDFHTTEKIYSSPLLYNDCVITSTGDGLLICFHKDSGKIKWLFNLKKEYYDNKIQKLFQTIIHLPFTFSFIRKMNMNTKCWSSPLIIEGKIFISSYGKGFYCIDADSGCDIWSIDLGYPRFQLSGAVSDNDNFIYFGSRKGIFYKYDLNGKIIWKFKIGGNFWGAPSFSSKHNIILLPSSLGERKGCVYAIGKDGNIIWKVVLKSAIYGSVSNDEDFGYCCDFAGYVYKINLTNGTIINKIKISNAQRALWTTPTIDKDGRVYIVTKDSNKDGRIIKMDSDFNFLWEFNIGKSLSTPVILHNGDVCVGSWDGYYYCLKTK